MADATRHRRDAWLPAVQASAPPSSVEKDAGYRGVCLATSQLHTLWGVAALPWNQWQLSRCMASSGDSKKRRSIYSACPRRGNQARVASDRLPRGTPETLLHSARLTYLTGVHASVAWQHCCGFGRSVSVDGAFPTGLWHNGVSLSSTRACMAAGARLKSPEAGEK